MSFQLNTNKVAYHAPKVSRTDTDENSHRQSLAGIKRMTILQSPYRAYSTGIAIQQKVIQMQSVQYKIQNAKDMLSAAETQLYGLKELFVKVKTKLPEVEEELRDERIWDKEQEATESLSTDSGVFVNAIETSLMGISSYKHILDTREEFLTSAISNSTALVSRMFDAGINVR